MKDFEKPTLCAVLLLVAALGCGGGDPPAASAPAEAPPAAAPAAQPEPPAQPTAAQPTAQPSTPTGVTLTPDATGLVQVTGNDQMRFNAARIEVKAGQKIKIELKNVGSLPKEAMGHNLVVLKPGENATAFATKAITAKATDFIPPDSQAQIIAHTKLLGPGEADAIELELKEPGEYPFVCTFPGHAALMNGVIVVGS